LDLRVHVVFWKALKFRTGEFKMKRILIAGLALVGTTAITAMTTNIVSAPFDYLRDLFARPEIGAELHFRVPENYPPIRGFVMTRTASGTNVEIQ
jgi:hypothetical protein